MKLKTFSSRTKRNDELYSFFSRIKLLRFMNFVGESVSAVFLFFRNSQNTKRRHISRNKVDLYFSNQRNRFLSCCFAILRSNINFMPRCGRFNSMDILQSISHFSTLEDLKIRIYVKNITYVIVV